jgi:hypothetical protein
LQVGFHLRDLALCASLFIIEMIVDSFSYSFSLSTGMA